MIKDWLKLLTTTFLTTIFLWYVIWSSAVVLFITGVQDAAFGYVLGGILALTTAAGYTGWKAKAVKDEYTD